jgi:hypothetical protein
MSDRNKAEIIRAIFAAYLSNDRKMASSSGKKKARRSIP